MRTLATFRLNLLRVFYLVLIVGLDTQIWPAMIHHVYSMTLDSGVKTCMLWALSTLFILGVRYPLQMLPLLLRQSGDRWCRSGTSAPASP